MNDFDKAGTIVGVFRNVRNTSFLYKQFPVALVYSHNTSHTFDVRLKQPYDESLNKLNEYMEQVHSTKALEFIPIDTMLKEIYRNVYRFRNSVWITSTFILLIVVMGLIGYVNDETQNPERLTWVLPYGKNIQSELPYTPQYQAVEHSRNDYAPYECIRSNKLKMQWSKVGATLGDYKEFIRTWGQAVNSMGFTDKQVGMQLDTISRRLGTLKADLMSMNVSAGKNGVATVIKDTITIVDRFAVGLKQIPAWTIEAALGVGVLAKAVLVLRDAIVATNVAALASRATPIGAALAVLSIAAVAATEAMGAFANAERDATAKATDQIAVAQQQEQQMEKQVEFADVLISSHQKLQEQIESTTEGTEAHNKAVENQKETEKQLTAVLGEAAVDRIRDAGWSAEAYDKEKQAFVEGVNKKKEALQIMLENQITALTNQKGILETQINNYWADVDAFKQSIFAKADALSWWQKIQASYYGHEKEFHQEQVDNDIVTGKQIGRAHV